MGDIKKQVAWVFVVSMVLVVHGVSASAERQDNAGAITHTRRLNKKDAQVDTPLCKAIKAGDAALVQKLLDEGANPNAPDARGYTPLWHVCMTYCADDPGVAALKHKMAQALYYAWADDLTLMPDKIRCVIAYRAIIEADRALPIHVKAVHASLWDEADKASVYTLLAARIPAILVPLVRECYGDAESVIIHPLKLRSQLSHRDRNQCLVDASFNGRETRVLEALYVGANINARNKRGWTALGSAAFNAHREIVKLLLWFGANVEKRNDSDETPLYEAMVKGDVETVSLLLQYGANVETRCKGQVSLHRAAGLPHEKDWIGWNKTCRRKS